MLPEDTGSPNRNSIRKPPGLSGWREVNEVRETAAMLGRASPLNPIVAMALKSDGHFIRRDAVAVIDDLDLLYPTGFDLHGNLAGASINGIFDQLFDYRSGTLHDLAGRDLPSQFWGEDLNRHDLPLAPEGRENGQKSGTIDPFLRYCLSSEAPVAVKSQTIR